MRLGLALAALVVGCNGCEPPTPAVTPERWQDATPDTEEAKRDPCALAEANVRKLGCKSWRPDYVEWCHAELSVGVTLCPTKKAHATTCAEAEGACR